MQLAIRDGLKEHHAATLIGKLRKVAAAARTSKIDAILHRRAGKGAILDQATGWASIYMKVRHLLDLKPFLEDNDNPNVLLTESQWRNVSQLEAVLAHSELIGFWTLSIVQYSKKLENTTFRKFPKPINSECYTPSSEPIRIYLCLLTPVQPPKSCRRRI
jgi:hypothetical protein